MSVVRVGDEIAAALRRGGAVVALESSVLSHGLPLPANRDAAARMTRAIRLRGAVPAVTAVVAGIPAAGLSDDEMQRLLARNGVIKVSARDIPIAMAKCQDGATTVAAAIAIASQAGIPVLATGGIGGVHRESAMDESADLLELSRTSITVVCSGAKSILDLAATSERLETLSIPVVGFRTSELPGFFFSDTGIAVSARVESVDELVAIIRARTSFTRSAAVLVVQRPPESAALPRAVVEAAVDTALRRAADEGIRGAAVTPFLLAEVDRATGGQSLIANLALLEANAGLAAEIAVSLATG
ncbi:MAG: pseudouridine-5'-phosphate glycosidase [Gemmatimonadaceae bacterium]